MHQAGPPAAERSELDLGALFDEHAPWLLRVLQRLTGRRDLAEDLVQEVFIIAWKRRDTLRDQHGIRTWLYRTAVNVARRRRRSESRYGDALLRFKRAWVRSPDVDAEQRLERRQQGRIIHAILERMSPKQREVFVLYELEGLEGAEIATILDIPINTVWSRLRLARRAFRARWEEEYR